MERKQMPRVFHMARRGLSLGLFLLVAAITLISMANCSAPMPIVQKEPADLLLIDRSLLTDSPCAAPCWQNIIPGISNEDDVRRQLEACPFVREGSINRGETEEYGVDLVYFTWESAAGKWDKQFRLGKNRLYLCDNVVVWIKTYLEYELTLRQVLDKYGLPEGIYVSDHPSDARYHVSMDYPHRGLSFEVFDVLSLEDMERRVAPVSEDMKVTSVYYFAPTSIEGELRDVHLLSPEGVEQALEHLQEWHGFGEYSLQ